VPAPRAQVPFLKQGLDFGLGDQDGHTAHPAPAAIPISSHPLRAGHWDGTCGSQSDLLIRARRRGGDGVTGEALRCHKAMPPLRPMLRCARSAPKHNIRNRSGPWPPRLNRGQVMVKNRKVTKGASTHFQTWVSQEPMPKVESRESVSIGC
jgi:hypothetical protein